MRAHCMLGFVAVAVVMTLTVAGFAQATRKETVAPGVGVEALQNWTRAETTMRNAQELRVIKAGAIQARMLTTTELRKDHAEAVKRLSQIAGSVHVPVKFLEIDGWPALQYRASFPEARTGSEQHVMSQKENRDSKDLAGPPVNTERSVTAVAVGNSVVRMDAELAPGADPALLDQAESMAGSLLLQSKGSPSQTEKDLHSLQTTIPAVPASTTPKNLALNATASKLTEATSKAPSPASTGQAIDVQAGFGEMEVAVTNDGNNVVIGANSGYSYSNNGGVDFTFGGGTPSPFPADGDPSLGVGASGNFYYGFIGYPDGSTAANGVQGCAVGVSASTNQGVTFPFLNFAAVCPETGSGICFTDQPHITSDRYNAGTAGGDMIYAVWRNFTPSGTATNCGSIGSGFVTPMISCSANGGKTFTTPVAIASGDWPRVSVGYDGSVYASYRDGSSFMVNKYSACSAGLVQQTGFPAQVSTVTDVTCPMPGLDRCNDGNTLSSQTVSPASYDPSIVYAAVAQHTADDNEDIWMLTSQNGGSDWSTPTVMNEQVAARRYMPWVCSSEGSVFVSWYDRREATTANNDLTDYYAAVVPGSGSSIQYQELNLSPKPDPQCASGWPCGARSPNDYNSCSVQPQNGFQGGGCPKYGDYNGNACINGNGYFAWASATLPAGANSSGINVLFATAKPKILLTICEIHPWVCYGEPNLEPYDPWIDISSIIVDGVIQQIDATQGLVTILVNNAYLPDLGPFTGANITASFRYASELNVGQHLVFFGGQDLLAPPGQVQLVGLMNPSKAANLKQRIQQHVEDQRFRQRTARASLIVTGEVTRVRELPHRQAGEGMMATVRISKVNKGDYRGKTVDVIFPRGTEARFVGVPRFSEGDKGIWLLSRDSNDDREYFAPTYQDFLTGDQAMRAEKLLK